MTSFSTLGNPGRPAHYKKENDPEPLQNPLVLELAQKYNKNPAQIILRQTLQRGIAVIPKSTNPDRIKSNREVFDFELTKEEMHKFEGIKEHRFFDLAMARDHPMYPYKD
uniref:NADP-dependent oxidoreductase domain-containing protein n=1 Tax=Acrobeloides nanus TaxID=290746 RepID=A0A914D0K4_9BILA